MSVNEDAPPLLVGLPPAMKLLTAAFLLYSSSTSRLCLFRMKRKMPPAIAAMATIPTTTPAAIPALLGPPEEGEEEDDDPVDELDEPGAVTTTVGPDWVMVAGFVVAAEGVDEGLIDDPLVSDELSGAFSALLVTPVR
jgi:hypothetical protein